MKIAIAFHMRMLQLKGKLLNNIKTLRKPILFKTIMKISENNQLILIHENIKKAS